MKRLAAAALFALFAYAATAAEPTVEAIVAASKLLDAPNYSWTTTTMRDKRSSMADCKIQVGGYALVSLPLSPAIRRVLGIADEGMDEDLTAVFDQTGNCVIKTSRKGWLAPTELPRRISRSSSGFSIAYPHEELAVIIANYTELKNEGQFVSGTLSETGAKLLLVKPAQTDLVPRAAKGTFRLWLKDGRLDSYEVQLEGTMVNLKANSNASPLVDHVTTNTVIKDVGRTQFDVPQAAREKLERR